MRWLIFYSTYEIDYSFSLTKEYILDGQTDGGYWDAILATMLLSQLSGLAIK